MKGAGLPPSQKGHRTYSGRGAPEVSYLADEQVKMVHSNVEHLHGPTETELAADDVVAVCPIRDGRPYLRTFLEHHFSLGVSHMVFLDNGSTDGTVEFLREWENVTVLRSDLPFKEYKIPMRRYLVERFGRNRWSLCVDVDELFDWPYSDIVSFDSLLNYLNSKGYTALMAQMLDMFSEEPLRIKTENSREDQLRVEQCRFYDLSNLQLHRYENHNVYGCDNVISNNRIRVLSGGIRKTVFGASPTLTKHPLVFLDGNLTPMDGHLHRVSRARVADFTAVLYHYKLHERLYEQSVKAVREGNYYRESASYRRYLSAFEKQSILHVKRKTSKEVESVNDLVDERFLTISEDYATWATLEEETRTDRPARYGPYRIPSAILKARRQLAVRGREAEKLKRKAARLDDELCKDKLKGEKLKTQNRELVLSVQILDRRLRAIQSSKCWRLISLLSRIRTKLAKAARSTV